MLTLSGFDLLSFELILRLTSVSVVSVNMLYKGVTYKLNLVKKLKNEKKYLARIFIMCGRTI